MSSLDKFLELLNTSNGVVPPLGTQELDIGPPTIIPVDEDGNNTTVIIAGKFKQGYGGSTTLSYRRINLPNLFTGMTMTAQVPPGISTSRQAVASLNEQFGLGLELEDVIDTVIAPPSAVIQLNPNSYVWIGDLPINVEFRMTGLDEGIQFIDLEGFKIADLGLN